MIPKEEFDEPGVEAEGGVHGEVAIVVSFSAAATAIVTAGRGNRGLGGEGARLKKSSAVDMPRATKRRPYSGAGGEPGLCRPLRHLRVGGLHLRPFLHFILEKISF